MRVQGQGRFLPLLVALGGLLLLAPLIEQLGHGRLVRVVFIMLLVVAVYALGDGRRHLTLALALALPNALAQAAALARPTETTLKLAVILALVFISYVTVVVLKAVLKSGKVTGDKIAGAICGYLLLGLTWAMLYALIELYEPEAFGGAIEPLLPAAAGSLREYVFVYYSFVTLTTLGYGEVVPVSSFARTAAWIEAVVGQLYIAILVARLVALQIIHSAELGED